MSSSEKEAKLTAELERIKILEGKISQVIDYIGKLTADNEKLRQQVKELKAGIREFEDQAKKTAKFEEDVKRYESERDAIKGKIEAIIGQIDKLGI
jgi:chromosome segregation ATPase